ncbi:MAG: ZPR1 zinc finger domain-containing protein [Candidatus Nezhaarchaeales archaeon]
MLYELEAYNGVIYLQSGVANMYVLPCPSCGREALVVNELVHDIPRFGKMLLVSMVCRFCGYRKSDVMSLEFKEPVRYEYRVSSVKDLSVRVIRSSTATIRIPELNAEIRPGPASEGFISNIEGVLHRIRDAVNLIIRSGEPEDVEKAQEVLRKMELALNGKLAFTLVLEDPYGNSYVGKADDST